VRQAKSRNGLEAAARRTDEFVPTPQKSQALFALFDEGGEYSCILLSFRGTRVDFL
jgi:hypothetical protein